MVPSLIPREDTIPSNIVVMMPKEIISSFAGEPTLSADRKSLLFYHHYFSEDMSQMIEADIYGSYRLESSP